MAPAIDGENAKFDLQTLVRKGSISIDARQGSRMRLDMRGVPRREALIRHPVEFDDVAVRRPIDHVLCPLSHEPIAHWIVVCSERLAEAIC